MKTLLHVLGLCVLATLSLSFPLRAQTPSVIPDAQAQHHVGQNLTVEGVVTAVTTSRNGNTFINFGGVYPNQTFTGWVPAGTPLRQRALNPAIEEINKKTDLSITVESLKRSKHRRVDALVFAIETQAIPKTLISTGKRID
jgi:hypothetical protein